LAADGARSHVVVDLVDALGLRESGTPLTLLGHSMGGPVVEDACVRLLGVVDAVVLVGGALETVSQLSRDPRAAFSRQGGRVAGALLRELGSVGLPVPGWLEEALVSHARLRRLALAPKLADATTVPDDVVRLLLGGAGTRGVFPAAAAFARDSRTSSGRGLRVPVLVVTGTEDRIVPSSDVAAFTHRVPQAQVRWVTAAGHLPMLERPAVVAEHVLAFLAGVEG
jgi:pimeloyl-ACP methyl ester carboxylesterase